MACSQPKMIYNRQLARLLTFFILPDKLFKSTNPSSFLELSKQGLYCESDNETEVSLRCMFCNGHSKLKTGNFEFGHLSCHDDKKYKDDVPVEFTPLQQEQAFTELSRHRNTLSPLHFKNFLDEFHSRDYENDPSQIVLALQKSLFNSPDNVGLYSNISDEDGYLRDIDHPETLATGINIDQDRTRDDNSSESTNIPTDHHLVRENDTNETSLELVITSNVSAVPISAQDIHVRLSQQQPTLQQRLSTFQDLHVRWPNPENMAYSGFSCIGRGSVQCFSCRGVIDDWLPGDNPYTKHKEEFPNCHHINHIFYVTGIPLLRSG
ncbi:uncharacterized protein LOC126810915 [Patella vulgata]|uniref:uncharacterized protein LOC126810915 n=1 Tax=Patella vulgata TaxID=6465 RepID=UPI002180458A|nr:uncharacterized protein LOC126810915 [Patella vulgata]XP_050392247.1 uncharacterized protein LOC126810915 [Patella vulgata]XP_050392248.1 uncharacterized protein LOC126810915 [Patella vulgata]